MDATPTGEVQWDGVWRHRGGHGGSRGRVRWSRGHGVGPEDTAAATAVATAAPAEATATTALVGGRRGGALLFVFLALRSSYRPLRLSPAGCDVGRAVLREEEFGD